MGFHYSKCLQNGVQNRLKLVPDASCARKVKISIWTTIYYTSGMSAIPKITIFCLPGPNKCSLKSQSPKIRKKLQKVSPNCDFRDPICLQVAHYFALGRPPGPLDSLCGAPGCPQTPKSHQNRAPGPIKRHFCDIFHLKL